MAMGSKYENVHNVKFWVFKDNKNVILSDLNWNFNNNEKFILGDSYFDIAIPISTSLVC